SSCYLRDLHSFPTRRSSDLGIGLATAKRFVNEGAYVFITGRRKRNWTRRSRRWEKTLPRFKETWRTSTISIGSSLKSKSKRASSDRKSTRLNSSHVAISYAV